MTEDIKVIGLAMTVNQRRPEQSFEGDTQTQVRSKAYEYVAKEPHCEFMNKLEELRLMSLK